MHREMQGYLERETMFVWDCYVSWLSCKYTYLRLVSPATMITMNQSCTDYYLYIVHIRI